MVCKLLEAGADVNLLCPYRFEQNTFVSPLGLACRSGHFNITCKLLEAGANVNLLCHCEHHDVYERKNYISPLGFACQKGYFNLACKLLEAGANIRGEGKRKDGDPTSSPLSEAAYWGHFDIVHLLIANYENARELKHDCRKASRWARSNHFNYLGSILEKKAEDLAQEIRGRRLKELG